MKDITNEADIKILVDEFYKSVLEDELLAPVFSEHLEGKWEEHHEKLYRFWQTVLLREPMYYGKPQHMHARMEIGKTHFDHWLKVWKKTVDTYFVGEIADRAKFRGKTMADAFFKKLPSQTSK